MMMMYDASLHFFFRSSFWRKKKKLVNCFAAVDPGQTQLKKKKRLTRALTWVIRVEAQRRWRDGPRDQ